MRAPSAASSPASTKAGLDGKGAANRDKSRKERHTRRPLWPMSERLRSAQLTLARDESGRLGTGRADASFAV